MIFAGITDPIQRPLAALLEWLHTAIGLPWAWAIIALTIIVRIVIVPLTVKQIRSMQHLQAHAPELKALQQKYKNDKKRQQEEVMRFYRENKINPFASCLPILLQIPVFISLFFVLNNFDDDIFPEYQAQGETVSDDLGWLGIVPSITDNINTHWSGYLLLVIYIASQVASTLFMATTLNKQQRYIFIALPFVFAFFIVNFPMGLMLYWVTTNLWTVGQGVVTRRLVPKPEPPPKRTSRTPPRQAEPSVDGATAERVQQARPAGGQQRVRRRKKKGPRSRR
jgi:YidC/Oxa1 family membrane protein insertase